MHGDARRLVMMLRQQSHDDTIPGRLAIPAWRAEAAEYHDDRLCKEIDSHDPATLIALWDGELMAKGADR